jgi:integrase/recombinase XerD
MSTAEQLLDAWELWQRSWGAAETTIQCRRATLAARLVVWPDVTEVSALDVQRWLAQPSLAAWSRVTYYNHARSFFGWLHETGQISTNPMAQVRRPRTPTGRPKPLTPDEVDAALAAAKGNVRAWLLLALYAGLRAHEIAKIRGEDVTELCIFVKGKGGTEAFLPTHPKVWALASEFPRSGWWFPGQSGRAVNANSVSILTGRLFDSLGIDGSIHRARHTYATSLLRRGTNIRVVQALMRHASLDSTALYTAVDEDELRAAVALL